MWIQTYHQCSWKRVQGHQEAFIRRVIDALGIYATKFPGNIIVSPDKDMKQIPGQLYNFDDVFTITPEQGAKWHLLQTMAGDNTDGYSGVPTIGVKRAEKIF